MNQLNHYYESMVEIALVEQWVSIAAGAATVAIIYLLWKTVKELEESSKLSRADIEREMLRDAALRSAATTKMETRMEEKRTIPEGAEQVAILLLPDTQDLTEFFLLYKRIQDSGLRNAVGIFKKVDGLWVEQQPPE